MLGQDAHPFQGDSLKKKGASAECKGAMKSVQKLGIPGYKFGGRQHALARSEAYIFPENRAEVGPGKPIIESPRRQPKTGHAHGHKE
ncbi:hypothetical protein HPB48_007803 [Haemaphysalis longicornis]|uniref:Uncharacterized protein n=1 Tax=Haemaphysalis longicornis TaxID=44386 RepID=A0A9J6FM09_HAELO|nr:hypothetical protein HPB48_007803 [Haemaphysalis longicornis]